MFSDDDNFGGNNRRYSYYHDFDLVKCFQMMIILGVIIGVIVIIMTLTLWNVFR